MGDEIAVHCTGEIEKFDESALNTRDGDVIKRFKEVMEQLVSFTNLAVSKGRHIC